jgi:hypothetical protein
MSEWLPCGYAAALMVLACGVGYWVGSLREQFLLLKICKPEI